MRSLLHLRRWSSKASHLIDFRLIHSKQSSTKVQCLVEQWVIDQFKSIGEADQEYLSVLKLFNAKDEASKLKIHYIVTLGGDGTILYAAKQFQGKYIPPIISFALVRHPVSYSVGLSRVHVQL